jgi:hypothetical protein
MCPKIAAFSFAQQHSLKYTDERYHWAYWQSVSIKNYALKCLSGVTGK